MTNEETIKMALKRNLPIQPIVFSNCYFMNKEKHLFEPGVYTIIFDHTMFFITTFSLILSGRIIISVMPIIETDGLVSSDVSNFSGDVSTKIRAEYDSISKITEMSDYQTPYP